MKIALLGTDPESILLARAAEKCGHPVVWCGDRKATDNVLETWPAEDLSPQWEALLAGEVAQAVIVGRGTATGELRREQISQLTKSGVPVLASFPIVDSVLAYYEIDMARTEGKAPLHHFNPLLEQQRTIDEISLWIIEGHPSAGNIEQVVWERPLAERTQTNVLWHFSRDVEFLSMISGGLNRLGALGSPDESATYAGLSVQLLGKSGVPVRWQVEPIDDTPNARLLLIAQHGKIAIEFNQMQQAVQKTISSDGQNQATQIEPVDAANNCVRAFLSHVESNSSPTSTWPRALAAMELTDTIEIALRRGRMIEVHQQQLTEQMAFKGTMSAVGCAVLLVIPPMLLFLGWIADLIGLPIAGYWPHVLLVLLGLFLGIQLLPKIVFKPDDTN